MYTPLISPPPFLFSLDSAFSTCIPGAFQGVDPPTAAETGGRVTGPGKPGCGTHPGGCGRHKRAFAHAKAEARAPVKTAVPK